MKTNASSTASAWGIKRCSCPCEVGTKITYGGSNLQLSMYKLHKRLAIVFLFYGNEIHTCFTVKDHIEDKIFKILYIISHNICNNIGPLLCQPLRSIRTIKSNRSMISFGRKHCKYDMHILGSTQHCRDNTINNTEIRQCCFDPTYFHAPFLCIAFKSFIDGKDYCTKFL